MHPIREDLKEIVHQDTRYLRSALTKILQAILTAISSMMENLDDKLVFWSSKATGLQSKRRKKPGKGKR